MVACARERDSLQRSYSRAPTRAGARPRKLLAVIPLDFDWLAARADAAVALLFHEPVGIEDEVVQQGREALQAALERRGMAALFR